MVFIPTASAVPYLFQPSDCTFSIALNADFSPLYAAWTTYAPVVTAQTGGPPTYTSSGSYAQHGKTISFTATVAISAVNTSSGVMIVSLPLTSKNNFAASGINNTTGGSMFVAIAASTATMSVLTNDAGSPWNICTYFLSGIYEST